MHRNFDFFGGGGNVGSVVAKRFILFILEKQPIVGPWLCSSGRLACLVL